MNSNPSWLLTILLSLSLTSFEAFLTPRTIHPFITSPSVRLNTRRFGSLQEDFHTLFDVCNRVAVADNTTQTLINFINLGDQWIQTKQDFLPVDTRSEDGRSYHTKREKVPGCMADVRISTSFVSLDGIENDDMKVSIDGTADSRVAQGILALLVIGLQDTRASQILQLSPALLSAACGLDKLLPVGRLNGLHNMVTLIQSQVRNHHMRSLVSEAVTIDTIDDGTATNEARLKGGDRGSNGLFHQDGRRLINDDEGNSEENKEGTQRVFQLNHRLTHINSNNDDDQYQRSSSSLGSSTASSLFVPPLSFDTTTSREEVAVLLSGGVDSSVALKLLLLQGYKVRAFYLKIWLEDEVAHLNECPWEEDLGYAQSVCAQLDVPLETLSLQKEYWQEVVQYTFDEAKQGRTPNPDIMCNSRIKFGMFYEYVGKHFAKIATGHYARVVYGDEDELDNNDSESFVPVAQQSGMPMPPSKVMELFDDEEVGAVVTPASSTFSTTNPSNSLDPAPIPKKSEVEHARLVDPLQSAMSLSTPNPAGRARLLMSPDAVKDQTYFLSNLRQDQLAKALFPIGHLQKPEVRRLAELYQLPTRHRKDSQGICFLGKLKFDEFISHYLGDRKGQIQCYETGRILGHHRGLWYHTIGQRKGLGPYLDSVVHEGPWYVAEKNADTNVLYVTNNLDVVEQPRLEFRVHQMNWVSGTEPIGLPRWVEEQEEVATNDNNTAATIEERKNEKQELKKGGMNMHIKLRHGPNFVTGRVWKINDVLLRVILDVRDKGIAPGQFAAFYCGKECLGAGVIVDTASDVWIDRHRPNALELEGAGKRM